MTLGDIQWRFDLHTVKDFTEADWVRLIIAAVPRTKLDGRASLLDYVNNKSGYAWTDEDCDMVKQQQLKQHILSNYEFDAVEISRIVAAYKELENGY